jgi:hypothetical protein
MSILLPADCEDLLYPSYQDRLIAKTLVNAGVVEENDYKVTAGTGLQVNVNEGNAYVAQTNAIQESSNSFYNGLYEIPNSTSATPSNNVEVSSVNPQIAQIILRVYDVNELKIGGSSYAKLEWLNGTPTAEATKTKMENGEYKGAAALPQSSFRCARVLVPKNASSSSSYYIEDARTFANSKYARESIHGEAILDGAVTGEKLGEGTVRRKFGARSIYSYFGVIGENGEILSEQENEFTSEKTSTGIYKITWHTAKSTEFYSAVATPRAAGVDYHAVTFTEKGLFVVYIYKEIGVLKNCSFSFNVISPT